MDDAAAFEHLQTFADVVQTGSFSGAARRHNIARSTVVRQIDTLEKRIGVDLVNRSVRPISITDAGMLFYERIAKIIADLSDARLEAATAGKTLEGLLSISCSPAFGMRYVVPVVSTLMLGHSNLRIELSLTDKHRDPVLDGVDAVIHIGTLPEATIARRMFSQKMLLVASPRYLSTYTIAEMPFGLRSHRLIESIDSRDPLGWAQVVGCPLGELSGVPDVFRSDDLEAMRAAALDGIGIALLPDWLVGLDVRAGTLSRVKPAGLAGETEPWYAPATPISISRSTPRPSAKLRAFIDELESFIGTPPVWIAH